MIDDEISYLVSHAYRCRRLAERTQEAGLRSALMEMASSHMERVRHLAAYHNIDLQPRVREQRPAFA